MNVLVKALCSSAVGSTPVTLCGIGVSGLLAAVVDAAQRPTKDQGRVQSWLTQTCGEAAGQMKLNFQPSSDS